MARSSEKMFATVLCAFNVSNEIVRMAVQVRRQGRVQRVAVVDVPRRDRAVATIFAEGKEKAMFPSMSVGMGAVIVSSVHDGMSLEQAKEPKKELT